MKLRKVESMRKGSWQSREDGFESLVGSLCKKCDFREKEQIRRERYP
jgi:hypothetical protein